MSRATLPVSPKRVYLHIGLHKTGTTYLQNLLRANQAQLADQDLHFPGGANGLGQGLAVWDLFGRRPRGSQDARIAGQWAALVEAVRTAGEPTVLISAERLSLARLKLAQRVVSSFPEAEVHVIVTARDLARVLVSSWQEEVKLATWSWAEYVDSLRDLENRSESPARGFWTRQDLPAILATWRSVVPPERTHLVTVPPRGAGPDLLTHRFCSVLQVDAARLTEKAKWGNETMGVAATEVVRRLNVELGGRLNQRQHERVVKSGLAPHLAGHAGAERFVLPEEELGWVTKEAQRQVAAVRGAGYDVVGDLDDLLPQPGGGRRPDNISDAEIADTALVALAALSERFAKSWWVRRPEDRQVTSTRIERLRSGARGVVFRGQRSAVKIADRNPLVGRALDTYLRRRRP